MATFSFMTRKTLVRIATAGALMFFFIGICIHFFCKLQARKEGAEIDLYAFVPGSCTAIIETGKIKSLIGELNDFRQTAHTPPIPEVSPLFTLLKQNLAIGEGKVLSDEINKVLISFHSPERNGRNQVIYCRLISSAAQQTETLIGNMLSSFPAKRYRYKGEEIIIYPLKNAEFIACYAADGFLAISYQKKLIEEVINTRLSGKSILKDKTFTHSKDNKRVNTTASFYIRYPFPDKWTEFDIKPGDKTLYISGICTDNNKELQPVDIPSDKAFPRQTVYLYRKGNNIHCLFYPGETDKQIQHIRYLPLTNTPEVDKIKADMRYFRSYQTANEWHPVYTFTDKYACFYKDGLLVAPKDSCIYNYIRNMSEEDTLELNCPYRQMLSDVNERSDMFLFADLSKVLCLPAADVPQVPEFFFRYQDYFKHFMMTMQHVSSEGKLSVNIVLHSITRPS